jgi:flagellar biosynthesis regulator FlbT
MTASTKSQLVEWITQLDDQELIETISAIKESVENGDWYKSLNDKQKLDTSESNPQ